MAISTSFSVGGILTPDLAYDLLLRNQTLIQRFIGGTIRNSNATLFPIEQAMQTFFARRGVAGLPIGPAELKGLQNLLTETSFQQFGALGNLARSDMGKIIQRQADYANGILKQVTPWGFKPNVPATRKIADRAFQGRNITGHLNDLYKSQQGQIDKVIKRGIAHDTPTADVRRDLRKVTKGTRKQAASLLRTGISGQSQQTLDTVFKANPELVKGYMWVATLDDRTTVDICLPRHGLTYDLKHNPIGHKLEWGDGPGKIHFNCRSTAVPLLKGQAKLPSLRTVSGWLRAMPWKSLAGLFGTKMARFYLKGLISNADLIAKISPKLHMGPAALKRTLTQVDRHVLAQIQRFLKAQVRHTFRSPINSVLNEIFLPGRYPTKMSRHLVRTVMSQAVESLINVKKINAVWFERILKKEMKFTASQVVNSVIPKRGLFTTKGRSTVRKALFRAVDQMVDAGQISLDHIVQFTPELNFLRAVTTTARRVQQRGLVFEVDALTDTKKLGNLFSRNYEVVKDAIKDLKYEQGALKAYRQPKIKRAIDSYLKGRIDAEAVNKRLLYSQSKWAPLRAPWTGQAADDVIAGLDRLLADPLSRSMNNLWLYHRLPQDQASRFLTLLREGRLIGAKHLEGTYLTAHLSESATLSGTVKGTQVVFKIRTPQGTQMMPLTSTGRTLLQRNQLLEIVDFTERTINGKKVLQLEAIIKPTNRTPFHHPGNVHTALVMANEQTGQRAWAISGPEGERVWILGKWDKGAGPTWFRLPKEFEAERLATYYRNEKRLFELRVGQPLWENARWDDRIAAWAVQNLDDYELYAGWLQDMTSKFATKMGLDAKFLRLTPKSLYWGVWYDDLLQMSVEAMLPSSDFIAQNFIRHGFFKAVQLHARGELTDFLLNELREQALNELGRLTRRQLTKLHIPVKLVEEYQKWLLRFLDVDTSKKFLDTLLRSPGSSLPAALNLWKSIGGPRILELLADGKLIGATLRDKGFLLTHLNPRISLNLTPVNLRRIYLQVRDRMPEDLALQIDKILGKPREGRGVYAILKINTPEGTYHVPLFTENVKLGEVLLPRDAEMAVTNFRILKGNHFDGYDWPDNFEDYLDAKLSGGKQLPKNWRESAIIEIEVDLIPPDETLVLKSLGGKDDPFIPHNPIGAPVDEFTGAPKFFGKAIDDIKDWYTTQSIDWDESLREGWQALQEIPWLRGTHHQSDLLTLIDHDDLLPLMPGISEELWIIWKSDFHSTFTSYLSGEINESRFLAKYKKHLLVSGLEKRSPDLHQVMSLMNGNEIVWTMDLSLDLPASHLVHDTVLWRGGTTTAKGLEFSESVYDLFQRGELIGAVKEWPSYMSTSMSSAVSFHHFADFNKPVLFKINARRGTSAAWTSRYGMLTELELTLPRNTIVKVTSAKKVPASSIGGDAFDKKVLVVDLEIVTTGKYGQAFSDLVYPRKFSHEVTLFSQLNSEDEFFSLMLQKTAGDPVLADALKNLEKISVLDKESLITAYSQHKEFLKAVYDISLFIKHGGYSDKMFTGFGRWLRAIQLEDMSFVAQTGAAGIYDPFNQIIHLVESVTRAEIPKSTGHTLVHEFFHHVTLSITGRKRTWAFNDLGERITQVWSQLDFKKLDRLIAASVEEWRVASLLLRTNMNEGLPSFLETLYIRSKGIGKNKDIWFTGKTYASTDELVAALRKELEATWVPLKSFPKKQRDQYMSVMTSSDRIVDSNRAQSFMALLRDMQEFEAISTASGMAPTNYSLFNAAEWLADAMTIVFDTRSMAVLDGDAMENLKKLVELFLSGDFLK